MRDELRAPAFGAWVDMFRWVAALSVLVTHVAIRAFVPIAAMPHYSVADMAYAFVAGFDHYAVMVFFVISGLLVGGAVVREIGQTGTVAFLPYIAKRLARLNVVLWPALLLNGLFASLAIFYGATAIGLMPHDSAATLSARVLACNLVFLQTAACPQFAENGALWSLFSEFWYYAAFPPLALAFLARRSLLARVALAGISIFGLAVLTMAQFTGPKLGPYMGIWLMGVAVAAMSRPLIRSPLVSASLFCLALLAVRLALRRTFETDHPIAYAAIDFIVSGLFANMLLSLKCAKQLPLPPAGAGLHRAFAGFSFSLYCIHVPLLNLYVAIVFRMTGWQWPLVSSGFYAWLAVAGALALSLGIAWIFSRLTEAHTDRVRRRLLSSWRPADAIRRG